MWYPILIAVQALPLSAIWIIKGESFYSFLTSWMYQIVFFVRIIYDTIDAYEWYESQWSSKKILSVQPFADGNKRTSRMLSNAVLLAHDYFPLSYRSIDVNEYRSAMIVFYEINNLYNYKRLYMKQLQFAIDNYFRE